MVPTLYADSPSMRSVVALIGRAATLRAGVLIRGEGGTGRRVVAEIIHAMDARSGPFVSVDCAGHDSDALERKLFGNVPDRGPAGELELVAPSSRIGEAIGGTLHLANLPDAPARVQHRLARVLRDREAARGDAPERAEVVRLDVRPMASADPAIGAAVADGRVREDLFNRFSAIGIDVPPLRKRREDMPALVRHFLRELCAARGLPEMKLSASAMALIEALPWHGNATELRGMLDAVLSAPTGAPEIYVENLLEHVRFDAGARLTDAGGTLREARDRFERDYISAVLSRHHGRISETARALGIQRTNLYRKLRSLRVAKDTHRM